MKKEVKEKYEVIEQFIDGFEPWAESLRRMSELYADDSDGCVICGIRPNEVKKLREAVKWLYDMYQGS